MNRRSFLTSLLAVPFVGKVAAKMLEEGPVKMDIREAKGKYAVIQKMPKKFFIGDVLYHPPTNTMAQIKGKDRGLIVLESNGQEFFMSEEDIRSGKYRFLGNSVGAYYGVAAKFRL